MIQLKQAYELTRPSRFHDKGEIVYPVPGLGPDRKGEVIIRGVITPNLVMVNLTGHKSLGTFVNESDLKPVVAQRKRGKGGIVAV